MKHSTKINILVGILMIVTLVTFGIIIYANTLQQIKECESNPDCNITQIYTQVLDTPVTEPEAEIIEIIKQEQEITTDELIYNIWLETMSDKEYNGEYGTDRYDCTEFANDFHDILEERKIETSIIIGFVNEPESSYGKTIHCWNEVNGTQYEPQKGRPIKEEKYKIISYVKRCW